MGSGRPDLPQGPARGAAGEVLARDLADAVADQRHLVAVVINTVDDSLAHGREGDEPGWQLGDLGYLRSLLDLARSAGRAVLVTSDHGHVLERDGTYVRVSDAASARHRTGPGPAGEGEVELSGPRVVAPDNRIVALWDPSLRYRPSRAGYHGGAALAEVTIPLLAFLLPNVTDPPTGWAAVQGREPDWWTAAAPPPRRPRRRPRHRGPRRSRAGRLPSTPDPRCSTYRKHRLPSRRPRPSRKTWCRRWSIPNCSARSTA
ncbi:BREX-2 system phosphatase PglZ [Micromonospora zhanjiangensis]